MMLASWLVAGDMACAASTPFPNPSGLSASFSKQGDIDLGNPFFLSLGTNGRTCANCHRQENGWSVTPQDVQQRFKDTDGLDPLFRLHDGANSAHAKVSSIKARRTAYSMLLNKGVFRIGLKAPENAEFELVAVSDPYNPSASLNLDAAFEFSLFRRPLPTTNLKFLSSVMWDGRETVSGRPIAFDLGRQANSATTGHAQGEPLDLQTKQQLVKFETALFTAQIYDNEAKSLVGKGIKGGPIHLSKQVFYAGINDIEGDSKSGLPNTPNVFTTFDAWNSLILSNPTDIRAAIARGQRLFNTKTLTISGVSGLNGTPEFGGATVFGTCSTCHNAPNAGSHSMPRFFNIGVSNESERTGDMPLYTLKNKSSGEILKTTDPGRALVSGQWQDIGRFKVPTLRGLAARAPYFHNGMAKELGNVVDFYDRRFQVGFDNRERLDLILFLRSL